MKIATIITVTTAANRWLKTDAPIKEMGFAFLSLARKRGASCQVHYENGTLRIGVLGLDKSVVASCLEASALHYMKGGKHVQFVQKDGIEVHGRDLPGFGIRPGSLLREHLTRKFVFSLPEGCYVVSNCLGVKYLVIEGSYMACRVPLFGERLSPIHARVELWERVRASGAASRICDVFWTEDEFNTKMLPRRL